MTTPASWRLLGAVNQAGAKLCEAESQMAMAEAKLREADSLISRIRAVAGQLGVELTEPTIVDVQERHGMSIQEFARHMGWGTKRMRALVRDRMQVGLHYHRNGCRYVVHPAEAAAFVRSIGSTEVSCDRPSVVDEVTRFRARQALRKVAK